MCLNFKVTKSGSKKGKEEESKKFKAMQKRDRKYKSQTTQSCR